MTHREKVYAETLRLARDSRDALADEECDYPAGHWDTWSLMWALSLLDVAEHYAEASREARERIDVLEDIELELRGEIAELKADDICNMCIFDGCRRRLASLDATGKAVSCTSFVPPDSILGDGIFTKPAGPGLSPFCIPIEEDTQ